MRGYGASSRFADAEVHVEGERGGVFHTRPGSIAGLSAEAGVRNAPLFGTLGDDLEYIWVAGHGLCDRMNRVSAGDSLRWIVDRRTHEVLPWEPSMSMPGL